MPGDPIVINGSGGFAVGHGKTLVIADCATGPAATEVAPLHVHHNDDEAWHVIQGALRFRLADRELIAEPGTTVIIPAGVAHTFGNAGRGPSRYLFIVPSQLDALVSQLQEVPPEDHEALFGRYDSQLLEPPARG